MFFLLAEMLLSRVVVVNLASVFFFIPKDPFQAFLPLYFCACIFPHILRTRVSVFPWAELL